MAWKTGPNAPLGVPAVQLTVPDPTAKYPIGSIREFVDDVLGSGEFIYLPGVAATAIGDLVEYDLTPGAQLTVRHSNATASNSGRPVAVAVAPVVATQFGWYQISGVAIVNATAGAAVGPVMATPTAGSINNAADAGDQILGARIVTAVGTPAAGLVYVTMSRPHVQGQIT